MKDTNKVLLGIMAWAVAISGLHAALNVDWKTLANDSLPESQRKLNVAFIPVT